MPLLCLAWIRTKHVKRDGEERETEGDRRKESERDEIDGHWVNQGIRLSISALVM